MKIMSTFMSFIWIVIFDLWNFKSTSFGVYKKFIMIQLGPIGIIFYFIKISTFFKNIVNSIKLGTILILCSSEKITLWCTFWVNLVHNYLQHGNVGEPYKNKSNGGNDDGLQFVSIRSKLFWEQQDFGVMLDYKTLSFWM